MNAVYTVQITSEIQVSQSFKLTERFTLSHITGQAVPENCSAITEAVLHEVSSRERDNYFVNRVP